MNNPLNHTLIDNTKIVRNNLANGVYYFDLLPANEYLINGYIEIPVKLTDKYSYLVDECELTDEEENEWFDPEIYSDAEIDILRRTRHFDRVVGDGNGGSVQFQIVTYEEKEGFTYVKESEIYKVVEKKNKFEFRLYMSYGASCHKIKLIVNNSVNDIYFSITAIKHYFLKGLKNER